MQMLLMTSVQADAVRGQCAGIYQIDPRPITGGLNIGLFAVPASLKTDARYERYWPMLSTLTVLDLDVSIAFPVIA